MTANDVHTIAKALPREEYVHLYALMSEHLTGLKGAMEGEAQKMPITDVEAQQYLYRNIFSRESIKKRLEKM